MTRLFAPVFWLTATIVLARLTAHLAPYLAGTDTLAEQVNGTLPAGMLYQVGLESLNTIFNLAVWFCIGWLIVRIFKSVRKNNMRNFNFILLLVAVFTVVGLSGCGPYPTEQAVEVKNNETAFVVPLEGDSKSKQAQFMSIEYLEKAKVATKRIVIPLRKRSLGRAWFDYEWIPLARVIVVDRSPVTREWLDKEGIKVESLDSVGFTVGVNCTGMIREEDAAKFLYYYPGNSLADVMNKNVKGFIQNVLAREFGSRDLSVCQKEKKNIVLDLAKELETHFAQYGITISNVGIADGMSYDNAEVQKTIDAVFVNETRVKQAEQEREAQKIINEKELSIAQNERLKAEEFAKAAEAQTKMVELKIRQMEAEARLESAKRWDGKTPSGVVPSNSPFLFQFGNK